MNTIFNYLKLKAVFHPIPCTFAFHFNLNAEVQSPLITQSLISRVTGHLIPNPLLHVRQNHP